MLASLWTLLLFPHLALAVSFQFDPLPNSVPFNKNFVVHWSTNYNQPSWDLVLNIAGEDHCTIKSDIPSKDQFTIVAINASTQVSAKLVAVGSNRLHLGYTSDFFITDENNNPTATITTTGPGTKGSAVLPETATPNKSESKTPIIVGATVGALVFTIGAAALIVFIRWRRRRSSSPRQVVFNRELMFQRRPSPSEAWTMRSVDAEKGTINGGTQVFVTRTATKDLSL
ncbi:hypothetical protein P691DRAFT_778074 [Macrolepiota fuliginosa MF-IS2]|uniref:Mid2 domain-containing protein n=1 Tax=Macrolepiota fuliginosa MF-IS2 TaxID=1400762 RepID=A0A9P6C0K8_9AGAR|nr:hypothetical protein P691DRAFT_778074 [Macrolepiota fuliginosa MF-IS2]